MSQHAWGDEATKFFYDLTPDTVLDAVEESLGERCTGRILALNSMENRVYEIELDESQLGRFVIAKFYRPGRWSRDQILEEHEFLADLQDHEIPAVAPLDFQDGSTLHELSDKGIYYTVFPKVGGRSPALGDMNHEDLSRVGRLLGRLHNVGAAKEASHRIELTPEIYGRQNLDYLLSNDKLPPAYVDTYRSVVEEFLDIAESVFKGVTYQRIHGDCHLGNLLFGDEGFFWVDFDDMVSGPCVQDLWLLLPGRGEEADQALRSFLSGYEVMREFDDSSLRLVEPLRTLRFVHFSAWIAKRWEDPAFQRAFPYFGTERYWGEQIQDLREQLDLTRHL